MLSVARSRFRLPAQLIFLMTNFLGAILGILFNHKTPNLYEKQKHRPIGWVGTWVALAWVVGSLIKTYTCYKRDPLSVRFTGTPELTTFESFDDNTSALLLGQSRSSSSTSEDRSLDDEQQHDDPDIVNDSEKRRALCSGHIIFLSFVSRNIGRILSYKRTMQIVYVTNIALDRTMLLLGFLCIATGVVVYGGIFVSVLEYVYYLSNIAADMLFSLRRAVATSTTVSLTSSRAASFSGMAF